jgi:hypothetical protein
MATIRDGYMTHLIRNENDSHPVGGESGVLQFLAATDEPVEIIFNDFYDQYL